MERRNIRDVAHLFQWGRAPHAIKLSSLIRKHFYMSGRTDWANAAMPHGGLGLVTKKMGLRRRKGAKPCVFLSDTFDVRDALVAFASKSSTPHWRTTADELYSGGMSCLINAIFSYCGFPSAEKTCGLVDRNSNRQGVSKLRS